MLINESDNIVLMMIAIKSASLLMHIIMMMTGVFVVKELILLDCINTYYYQRKNLLSDDEYNDLKESLSWEGSAAVTLSAKEAHFISAVSAYNRYRCDGSYAE